ncbi:TadA family conjugal transfer-associated ATPase [Arcanobacterium haemolyticum]|nr:TadA family conjugal transfer-associated ATPase [Arcanobacterium haemolyticum]
MTARGENAGKRGAHLHDDDVRNARVLMARGKSLEDALAESVPRAVSTRSVLGAGRQLRSAIAGAGILLQPLIDDECVTDILINGTRGVWVDRGDGLEPIAVRGGLTREEDVRALAVRLATACGQRLDDQSPIVDGTFPGGMRLHAVLPPLAREGALISLRTQKVVSMSLDDLDRHGTVPREVRPILNAMVSKRANVMISGATGSGKTTLLAAILASVPSSERILVIEESAELRPRHPHVVHLQMRRANVQGAGEITMSELVRAAMRMRPDRIVLGECRGAEVREVVAALNTGHDGGWATIHANSAVDVPTRLVALGALAGMGENVVAAQCASALDAVIHVQRDGSLRQIKQIATLERAGGELRASEALVVDNGIRYGPGWAKLASRLGLPDSGGQSL